MSHEDRDVRKVTISLDEETVRWARVQAAECDQSLSRYVAALLERERDSSDDYEAAMDRFFARPTYPIRDPAQPLPRRDELYDRDG